MILGVIGLLISIGFIISGLKNSESDKSLFNISRLLALLSVIGVWYFGNILTKKTTKEIGGNRLKTAEVIRHSQQLEVNLAEANKRTEEAKFKTTELEIDVQGAQIEVQEAKRQTALVQLEVAKTNAIAEKAKLERDKLKDKLDYIKSISAIITLTFMSQPQPGETNGPATTPSTNRNQALLILSGTSFKDEKEVADRMLMLDFQNWSKQMISEEMRKITFRFNQPTNPNDIYGARLKELDSYKSIHFISEHFANMFNIDLSRSHQSKFR